MLEKIIETKLRNAITQQGGMCLKFVSPGVAGVPDRIVLMPKGKLVFVELKAPNGKVRPLQTYRHKQLKKLGFTTYIINDERQIDELLKELL